MIPMRNDKLKGVDKRYAAQIPVRLDFKRDRRYTRDSPDIRRQKTETATVQKETPVIPAPTMSASKKTD